MCTHDLDGRVLWMNEHPAVLLGYRPEDLIGRYISEHLFPGNRAEFAAYIDLLKSTGFASGIMALQTKTGGRRVWEYRNLLRTEGVSKPIVRGVARDVTEQFVGQKILKAMASRLKAVLDSVDEIAFEFDADGTFMDIWTIHEERLQRPRSELLGRTISEVMGTGTAVKYRDVFERVLESGEGEDLEYPIELKDGIRYFLCRVAPVRAAVGARKTVLVLARDITDRKKVESSLRLFRALIDSTLDAIEVVDPVSLRFLDVNHAACSDLLYTREEMLSMTVYDTDPTLTPESYERLLHHLRMEGSYREERLHRRKDGTIFPVELNISLVKLDSEYLVAVARDITDRKSSERALRQFSDHLLRTQDKERRQLARELHDGVGSLVTGMSLALGRLRGLVDVRAPASAKLLRDWKALIQAAGDEIRTISYLLHPPVLDQLGLQATLKEFIEGFAARSKIETNLEIPRSIGRFSQDIELTVFRVVQESLNNVYRHSGSETAKICLVRNDRQLVLEISDTGKGMKLATGSGNAKPSVGIAGMRERLRLIGGTFSIENLPRRGCVVRAVIEVGPESPAVSQSPRDRTSKQRS